MPDGYAMLIRPNKAEAAVHGCHCQSDMALRMRKVLAKPWVGVRVCHFLLLMSLLTHRPVHALRGIMGNQGKFTKKQSRKTNVFLYNFRSDFRSGDETYTAGEETPNLGLRAFLSRSSECCGPTNFFLQLKPNDSIKS